MNVTTLGITAHWRTCAAALTSSSTFLKTSSTSSTGQTSVTTMVMQMTIVQSVNLLDEFLLRPFAECHYSEQIDLCFLLLFEI